MDGVTEMVMVDRGADIGVMPGATRVVKRRAAVTARQMKMPFCINSEEVPKQYGSPGDYIIQDRSGGLHVCSGDTFFKLYEVVA